MNLYGICNLPCKIEAIPYSFDIKMDLCIGTLVEIVDTIDNIDDTENSRIQILKFSNPIIQEIADFYLCPKDKLIMISHDMMGFFVSINDLDHRVSFARSFSQIDFIKDLRVGHIAAVFGGVLFNERKYFECRVKYIGPVVELGRGRFIAVEFLHCEEKPQNLIPLAIIEKYVKCVGYKGVIITANWLISIEKYRQENNIQLSTFVPNADPVNMEAAAAANFKNIPRLMDIQIPENVFLENRTGRQNDVVGGSGGCSSQENNIQLSTFVPNADPVNMEAAAAANFRNIPRLMDIQIPENVFLENRTGRQNVVGGSGCSSRRRRRLSRRRLRRQLELEDNRPRQDNQEELNPDDENYNNQWDGRKFIILNSIYKTRCSFCANVKEFCEFKKEEGNVGEIVPFQNQFRCRKCFSMHDRTDMIVVNRCFHVIGKKCLAESVNMSDGGPVHCPAKLGTTCHTIFSMIDLKMMISVDEFINYFNKRCYKKYEEILKQDKQPKKLKDIIKITEFEALLTLEEGDMDVVENVDAFECPICFLTYEKGEGVILRECLHVFCKECLAGTINMSDSPEIKCPFMNEEYTCDCFVQDREIRAVITKEDYERYLTKSLNFAEKLIKESYHCVTVNCKGWWINEDKVNLIMCPVCNMENCLNCNAIHTNLNCKEYQEEIFNAPDKQAQRTKQLIDDMLVEGIVMKCPQCGTIIERDDGCDWIQCNCYFEICWATKGARWGPGGFGDISGGCRCKVDGRRCTPTCRNCH